MKQVLLDAYIDFIGERDQAGKVYCDLLFDRYTMTDGSELPCSEAVRIQDVGAIAHDSEVVAEMENQLIYIESRHFPDGLVDFNYIHPQTKSAGARQLRQKVYRVHQNVHGVLRGEANAANLRLRVAYIESRQQWEVVAYEPR